MFISNTTCSICSKIFAHYFFSSVAAFSSANKYSSTVLKKLSGGTDTAQLEKLINADARLRQLVNRIINGEVEQVQNILKPDSTEKYLNF